MATMEEWHEPRPFPCPKCGSTKGYSRVGTFRSQCLECNSLVRNEEINREDYYPAEET